MLFTSCIGLHLEFFEERLVLLVKHIVLPTKEKICIRKKDDLLEKAALYAFNV